MIIYYRGKLTSPQPRSAQLCPNSTSCIRTHALTGRGGEAVRGAARGAGCGGVRGGERRGGERRGGAQPY